MVYLDGKKVSMGSKVTIANLPVDQEYNPESEKAQSGKAVAQAISTVSGDNGGTWEKLVDCITTEEVNSVILTKLEMSKCKEFMLRIVYPVTEATLSLGAGYCYLNDYEHPAFRFSSTTVSTSKVEHRCHIIIAEKLIYSVGTQNSAGQSSITTATYMLVGDRFISGDVTKIICRLNTNTSNYPVGTQFIVYGKVEG